MRYNAWQAQPAEPFKNTLPNLVCHVSLWDRHLLRGTHIPALNCCLHHGHTMWGLLRESHQYRASFLPPLKSRFSQIGLGICVQQTSALPVGLGERGHLSNQSISFNVPQRANGFVSIHLAVPHVRPASRQPPVTGIMNGSWCIRYQPQTWRHARDTRTGCEVALQSTIIRMASAKYCGCILLISHRADFLLDLSPATLSNYRKTPLSSARLTTCGHCAPSSYIQTLMGHISDDRWGLLY